MWYLNTDGAKEAHHQRVAPRGQPTGLHSEGQEAPRGLHYIMNKKKFIHIESLYHHFLQPRRVLFSCIIQAVFCIQDH